MNRIGISNQSTNRKRHIQPLLRISDILDSFHLKYQEPVAEEAFIAILGVGNQ